MKRFFLLIFFTLGFIPASYADLPVIDWTNYFENAVTAMQTVAMAKEQLKQYAIEFQNATSLDSQAYIWNQIQNTINNLLQATDTLDYYTQQAGSLHNYLARYQDAGYYQNSPCFSAAGCTDAQRQALYTAQVQGSEAQKRANDAMLAGIAQQQDNLKAEAGQLMQLQSQAQTAAGRMQALQTANQLASAVANQLFQIRALLIAQQNAEATQAEVQNDKNAQQEAADKQLLSGDFVKSPVVDW